MGAPDRSRAQCADQPELRTYVRPLGQQAVANANSALRLLSQLACGSLGMERAMGIEPTLSGWEPEVLPLNYTRADADSTRVCRQPAIARSWPGWRAVRAGRS